MFCFLYNMDLHPERVKDIVVTFVAVSKWSNTFRELVSCLSVFDHFVGFAIKGLRCRYTNIASIIIYIYWIFDP